MGAWCSSSLGLPAALTLALGVTPWGEATPLIYKAHIHFDPGHLRGQSFNSWPFPPCQSPAPWDRHLIFPDGEKPREMLLWWSHKHNPKGIRGAVHIVLSFRILFTIAKEGHTFTDIPPDSKQALLYPLAQPTWDQLLSTQLWEILTLFQSHFSHPGGATIS